MLAELHYKEILFMYTHCPLQKAETHVGVQSWKKGMVQVKGQSSSQRVFLYSWEASEREASVYRLPLVCSLA